jgi:hypothetical protein
LPLGHVVLALTSMLIQVVLITLALEDGDEAVHVEGKVSDVEVWEWTALALALYRMVPSAVALKHHRANQCIAAGFAIHCTAPLSP